MRFLLMTLLTSLLVSANPWETDLAKAQQTARSERKIILLNFSGSDWCGPCIKMHNDIFESKVFTSYANDHLVLVNADFPRLKKNQLSKEQQSKNDQLADAYNKEGIFPLTILLSADGKILRSWKGFPQITPDEFTEQVKAVVDANK